MLIFLSSTTDKTAELAHPYINDIHGNHKTTTYIAFKSDPARKYFYDLYIPFLEQLGVARQNITYFDIDAEYSPELAKKALLADIVLLPGGNTPNLLHRLKQRELFAPLQEFEQNPTKTIIGVSAGGVVLGPTIKSSLPISGLPDTEEDPIGLITLEQMQGLNLVDFEFYPHFETADSKLKNALQKYVKQQNRDLYALEDSGILVVKNQRIVHQEGAYLFTPTRSDI